MNEHDQFFHNLKNLPVGTALMVSACVGYVLAQKIHLTPQFKEEYGTMVVNLLTQIREGICQ